MEITLPYSETYARLQKIAHTKTNTCTFVARSYNTKEKKESRLHYRSAPIFPLHLSEWYEDAISTCRKPPTATAAQLSLHLISLPNPTQLTMIELTPHTSLPITAVFNDVYKTSERCCRCPRLLLFTWDLLFHHYYSSVSWYIYCDWHILGVHMVVASDLSTTLTWSNMTLGFCWVLSLQTARPPPGCISLLMSRQVARFNKKYAKDIERSAFNDADVLIDQWQIVCSTRKRPGVRDPLETSHRKSGQCGRVVKAMDC